MTKLGFNIPDDLDERLRKFVPWGSKGIVVEGLIRAMVEREEKGDHTLYAEAVTAYWNAHK